MITINKEDSQGIILEDGADYVFVSYNDLPEFIHLLNNILHDHLHKITIPDENWLTRQLRIARSEVHSWPSWKQKVMKDQL